MTEETRKKIEELEEKQSEILNEIYRLKESEKGYYIGIGDNDYSCAYYRLGWCTENEAKKTMESKGDFVLGFEVEEVSEEYNSKMYKVEKLQNILKNLDDRDFEEYKEMREKLKTELKNLKEELHIYGYIAID